MRLIGHVILGLVTSALQQQSKQLIWERSDYDQLIGELTKQLVEYKHKYKHSP